MSRRLDQCPPLGRIDADLPSGRSARGGDREMDDGLIRWSEMPKKADMRIVTIVASMMGCFWRAAPANAWEWPLQCVPFARAVSGITLFGDAWRWWSEAAGRYGRGHRPQPGGVLSFS